MTSKFVALCVALFITAPAHALQLDADGCRSLAQFVASAAQMRDIGANKDKHMAAVVKANAEQPPELLAFLKKALAGVYASKATPQELAEATMQVCLAQEGKLGEGV